MTTGDGPLRRPGGRSERVRAAVHEAATELIAVHGYGRFTVADVAKRAGVADSTVYRRWGGLEALIMDVIVHRLNTDWPVPDTGTLTGDLREFAANVAKGVVGPDALTVMKGIVATFDVGESGEQMRELFLAQRTAQIQVMLDRARLRGERTPTVDDVVELVMAPMYFRYMFSATRVDADFVERLLRRLGAT